MKIELHYSKKGHLYGIAHIYHNGISFDIDYEDIDEFKKYAYFGYNTKPFIDSFKLKENKNIVKNILQYLQNDDFILKCHKKYDSIIESNQMKIIYKEKEDKIKKVLEKNILNFETAFPKYKGALEYRYYLDNTNEVMLNIHYSFLKEKIIKLFFSDLILFGFQLRIEDAVLKIDTNWDVYFNDDILYHDFNEFVEKINKDEKNLYFFLFIDDDDNEYIGAERYVLKYKENLK